MIISVPHSGTRTLKKLLGLTTQWHFGINGEIQTFRGLAHIPIRNPVDIMVSWLARYKNEPHKWDEVIPLLEMQMEWVKDRCDTIFHVTEELTVHEGKGPDRDRAALLKTPQVKNVCDWLDANWHFYGQFYDRHG